MRSSLFCIVVAGALASASPASSDGKHNHGMPVVKTTVTDQGQIVDWVPIGAQGVAVASPPPLSMLQQAPTAQDQAAAEAMRPKDRGPAGTVPVLRASGSIEPMKRLPQRQDVDEMTTLSSYAGQHWYASSAQTVDNHGGVATYSVFEAFLDKGSDFSLLQVAVERHNAARSNGKPVVQTIESGWINNPSKFRRPHLFIFFTTNGYEGYGDYVCGWNQEYKGWVQVDSDIFPGVTFSPLATIGGPQSDIRIGFVFFEGNWWLNVMGRWVGYYPGNMFSKDVHPNETLNSYSDKIGFYGEVYNSGNELTTTDMGSGEFPEAGLGKAAYLKNIAFFKTDDTATDYDGSGEIIVSDEKRYGIKTNFSSGTSLGSYFFLGGPGAGGVVGG